MKLAYSAQIKDQAISMDAENNINNNMQDNAQESGIQDSKLMALIANGDKEAMSEFINRNLDSIINFATRYTGQRSDAEDIAQEAFTRVWTKASQWKQQEIPVKNWLFRITYNLCIDMLRKRKTSGDTINEDNLVSFITPEDQLATAEKQNKLNLMLKKLPERQCTAILFCHYQGISNKEAANIMDISIDALESLLSRGRRKLRELLL